MIVWGVIFMKGIISLQQTTDMTLEKAFEQFICEKKALNLSEDTIKTYKRIFGNFTDFFPEKLCKEVSSATIFQFVEFLQTRNPKIKIVTVNSYLRHLRAIFYYFMEAGYMNRFSIKMIKYEKDLKETYSMAELERLLKKPDIKATRFSDYRNWVMINYFVGTGNRLNTVCNLKIADIDFENHEIVLRKVKNKKPYTIPLTPTLEKTLAEYLRYRKGERDEYLFCSQYGGKLSRDSVTTAIYRYNRSRGVTKTSVHLFRHTFATEYLRNGGREGLLQKLLGHSTPSMTNEYVHMVASDLKENFEQFNPLEKLKNAVHDKKAIHLRP